MSKDDSPFITALSVAPEPTPPPKEVGEYYNLVRGLLCQIDEYQDILEKSRHLRIRNGVINVHSAESVLLQHIHGQAANQLFDDPIFRVRDASFPATHQPHTKSDSTDETAKRGEMRTDYSRTSHPQHKLEQDKPGKFYVYGERECYWDEIQSYREPMTRPSASAAPETFNRCEVNRPLATRISQLEREMGDEPPAHRDSYKRGFSKCEYPSSS